MGTLHYFCIIQHERGVAQVVEHLSRKEKALNSNPSTIEKKTKTKKPRFLCTFTLLFFTLQSLLYR
jgi:hypothetical protein